MRPWILVAVVACALTVLWPAPSTYSAPPSKWPMISRTLEIVEYPIEADSYAEALQQCKIHGKHGWRAYTTSNLVWKYKWGPYDHKDVQNLSDGTKRVTLGGLKIQVTEVKSVQVTYLPKLKMGKKFPAGDKKKWKTLIQQLREHEEYHQRIASVEAIEKWLKRRVASIKSVSSVYKEDVEVDAALKKTLISSKLSAVYNHAEARIRDKNIEVDQLTDHGVRKIHWKKFLEGYF